MNAYPEPPEVFKIPTDDPDECTQIGLNYYNKNRHSNYAYRCFRKAAGKDHAEAQFMVGSMYYFGESRDPDQDIAAEWFLKAQKNGSNKSLILLGIMIEEGYQIPDTFSEISTAIQCYKKALKSGVKECKLMYVDVKIHGHQGAGMDPYCNLFTIGKMYYDGAVMMKDREKAAHFLLKAYEAGSPIVYRYLQYLMNDDYDFTGTILDGVTLEELKEDQCKRLAKQGMEEVGKDTKNTTAAGRANIDLSNLTIHDSGPPKSESSTSYDGGDDYDDKDDETYSYVYHSPRDAKDLDSFIGLNAVKEQLANIKNIIAFNQKRKAAGLKGAEQSHHFVLTGNPGSGKTEIARTIGAFLKTTNLLKKGHVVEVDRSKLVGGYIGKTAEYTQYAIQRALDGVLFIDEAHALYGEGKDYGQEAINTIVKAMEDHRDRLVIIMAGYPEQMDMLLRSNPGLKSRFRHKIHFEDYSAAELTQIYEKFCEEADYNVIGEANDSVLRLMREAKKLYDQDFGNGRFVRNAFDRTIEKMAVRVMNMGDAADQEDMLKNIMFMDIPTIEEIMGGAGKPSPKGDNNNVIPL